MCYFTSNYVIEEVDGNIFVHKSGVYYDNFSASTRFSEETCSCANCAKSTHVN